MLLFLGHHTRLTSDDPDNYSIENCNDSVVGNPLRTLTEEYLTKYHNLHHADGASVNNGPNLNGYNEPVIKDRVMHLLQDMIAAGY